MSSPSTPRTVLVYGGSFDPPHLAHVMVADAVRRAPGVDALWIIPTYQHYFDKPLTPFVHRLRMCELAFRDIPDTQVLNVEQRLGGKSLMVRTLRTLAAENSNTQLRLVIGSDLIDQLERWSEPDAIRELAPPWIVQREGSVQPGNTERVFPAVSSTQIRTLLANGEDASVFVPRTVLDYIHDNGLYAVDGQLKT